MKKSMRKISMIIGVILIGLFVIDYVFETNIVNRILINDKEAPTINVDQLPRQYLLNREFNYSIIVCEDNHDESCDVEIIDSFDTSVLGVQSITLKAIDSSGNSVEKVYQIEIVENADSSMYIPLGYYDSIEGLEGSALKSALNDIITGHIEYIYSSKNDIDMDVWELLKITDEDPDNENNVLMFYSGFSMPKECQDGSSEYPESCYVDSDTEGVPIKWNREHVWSKSRGDFEIKEGTTTVLALGAHTDLHHLVPEESSMNSTKNNRMFEDCNDGDDTNVESRGYGNYTCNIWSFEPRDEVKGDVARMLFYMSVRYEGEEGDMVDLELVNDPVEDKNSKLPEYGDLDDLLRWHLDDPVSEYEIFRNQTIYTYQNNRNPFIDIPELVELIWGNPEDYN